MIAEFKINQTGIPWEDIPVTERLNVEDIDYVFDNEKVCNAANSFAQTLADKHQQEVRWNWQGSYQGHYIGGEYKLKA